MDTSVLIMEMLTICYGKHLAHIVHQGRDNTHIFDVGLN